MTGGREMRTPSLLLQQLNYTTLATKRKQKKTPAPCRVAEYLLGSICEIRDLFVHERWQLLGEQRWRGTIVTRRSSSLCFLTLVHSSFALPPPPSLAYFFFILFHLSENFSARKNSLVTPGLNLSPIRIMRLNAEKMLKSVGEEPSEQRWDVASPIE